MVKVLQQQKLLHSHLTLLQEHLLELVVTLLIPKDNSDIAYDFEFFLGRVDSLFLTSEGDFKVVSGNPAEDPDAPNN